MDASIHQVLTFTHTQETATMSWTKPCCEESWQEHCGQRCRRKREGSDPQTRVSFAQQECQRMRNIFSGGAALGRRPESPLSRTSCCSPRARGWDSQETGRRVCASAELYLTRHCEPAESITIANGVKDVTTCTAYHEAGCSCPRRRGAHTKGATGGSWSPGGRQGQTPIGNFCDQPAQHVPGNTAGQKAQG